MKDIDEPIIERQVNNADNSSITPALIDRITKLVLNQPYGVLCTQANSQPYGSLVAFATSADLAQIAFATPVTTRKYHLMKECPQVSMVIDSRQGPAAALMEIEAVTATGISTEISRTDNWDIWANLLTEQHQYLKDFLSAETCALFVIEVCRYFHVSRFQEVSQWIPAKT